MYLKKQKKFVHFKLKNGLDQTIPPPTTTTHNHPPPFKIYSPPTTTHHHPQQPTTSQNISTTTHHHPPPAKIYPPPPTTTHQQPKYIHHHPPPAKVYPPLPTISQKMDHHPAKAKIYWYITSFRHCFNSFFFFEMQYSFPWWRFCVIKFWSVRFSNSKFLLHSVLLQYLRFSKVYVSRV